MKKRLLKDLPFNDVKVGSVIFKGSHGHGDSYCIDLGEAIYDAGGSSSNGCKTFKDSEENILNAIWENDQWFEEATLNHIDIIASTEAITLRFKSLDLEEAQTLAKGIQHWIMYGGPLCQDTKTDWDKSYSPPFHYPVFFQMDDVHAW